MRSVNSLPCALVNSGNATLDRPARPRPTGPAVAVRSTPPSDAAPWWTRPGVILVVALAIRLVALWLIEGEVNDGVVRIETAAHWIFESAPTFGRTVWPEGNYVLPGFALLVWREPYWSVRILFALLAVTNVWLVQRVATEAFDRRTGAVAGWILALMPAHLLLSANGATSEVPYISAIFAAIWAVMRYRHAPALRWAVLAGLAVALATTFRNDGVIWGLPLAAAFVLWPPHDASTVRLTPRTILHLTAFGVCGLLYVVAVFWQWSRLYPTPWYPLDQAALNTQQFFVNGHHPRWPDWVYQSYVVAFWPATMFALLTPGVALLAWIGLAAATRAGRRTALPLTLGFVTVILWLAFAAFRHSILAQFRYALILAAILGIYTVPGIRALRRFIPRLATGPLVAAVVLLGVAWQGVVTDAALHDRGVLTNQLSLISPVQRSPFASRHLLAWANEHATRARPLVVSPFVQSPYYALENEQLTRTGRVVNQSYYLPGSQLVHTRASLTDALTTRIRSAGWVATGTGNRQLGLRDALERELVRPERVGDHYEWRGIVLTPVATWGDIRLWRVETPSASV